MPAAVALGRISFSNLDMSVVGTPTMDDVRRVLANPEQGYEAFMDRYPRYWGWKWWGSYDEELSVMQAWQAGLEAVRLARTNGAFIPALKKLGENISTIGKLHPHGMERFRLGMADGRMHDFLLKIEDMETERRLLVTAIALKRYQLRQGKYPD